MKIRFDLTIDDLIAFHQYYQAHSPTVRRSKTIVIWLYPAVIVLLAVALALKDPVILVFGVVGAAIFPFIFAKTNRRCLERQLSRLYSEGDNKGILGPHELELTEFELVERTPHGEQRRYLKAVDRVATDKEYTFIFLTSVSGHVIPHQSVYEGDHDTFVEAVRNAMLKAHTEPAERADNDTITSIQVPGTPNRRRW